MTHREITRTSKNKHQRLALATAFVIITGLAIVLKAALFPSPQEHSRRKLVAAFEARKPNALPLAIQHLEQFPNDPLAITIAGEFALRDSDWKLANRYFSALPRDGAYWEFHSNVGMARSHIVPLKLTEIEAHLRRALELSPYDIPTCERMGHLLQVEGRTWEGAPFFMRQILHGKCRGDELLAVACAERFYRSDDRFSHLGIRDDYPNSPMQIAHARSQIASGETDAAEKTLRTLINSTPELGEAQGRLGRLIVDRGDHDAFFKWQERLPDSVRNHPEVWFAHGLQARRLNQEEGAASCFINTLKLSPAHIGASLQLAQSLERLGHSTKANHIALHGRSLGELDSILNNFRTSRGIENIQSAIPILINLRRYWEAAGWNLLLAYMLDTESNPESHRIRQEMNRLITLARQNSNSADIVASLHLPEFAAPNSGLARTLG